MRFWCLLLGALVACSARGATDQPTGVDRPSIVVILADDFGVGCINAFGADERLIQTPHLNRLATEGMRFTDAYAPGSVCTPTRYAFITGRYAWRGRLKTGVVNPGDPLLIEEGRPTIASMLREQGYRTAHIGKWHLGYTREKVENYAALDSISPGPNAVGFDYHFGVPNNIDDAFRVYFEDDQIFGLRSRRVSPYSKSFYGKAYHGYDAPQRRRERVTGDLSRRASEWIEDTVRDHPDRPFFLYFAPVAVHHPIEPSEPFRGTSGVGAYGDFIHELDNSVGSILDALERNGALDNTIVVFSADNGADSGRRASPEDQAIEAGLAINGALRGDKHTIWEGGVRVPLIVRWPGHVAPGTVSDRLVSLADIYATTHHLLTGEMPARDDEAPDSFSFADALTRIEAAGVRTHLVVNNATGVKAIRSGPWKLIEGVSPDIPEDRKGRVPPAQGRRALYRLDSDVGEASNVLGEYPEVEARLQATLEAIRASGSERAASGKQDRDTGLGG